MLLNFECEPLLFAMQSYEVFDFIHTLFVHSFFSCCDKPLKVRRIGFAPQKAVASK